MKRDADDEKRVRPSERDDEVAYEPPQLKKYGSLAHLTRSGTGTAMEGGKATPRRFA